MPEYLHPGVYIEEVDAGAKSIEGVSTSTAGFIGKTERGPVKPVLVTSFPEYQNLYGGYLEDSFMTYSIDGFFKNGGKRCFIARLIGQKATIASLSLSGSSGGAKTIIVQASGHGLWGNNVRMKISRASLDKRDSQLFKLEVRYYIRPPLTISDKADADIEEVFDNLSVDKTSSNYYVNTVNNASKIVKLFAIDSQRPKDSDWQALSGGSDNGLSTSSRSSPLSDDKKSKSSEDAKSKTYLTSDADSSSSWEPNEKDYDGYEFQLKDPTSDDILEIIRSGLLGFNQVSDISIVNAPDEPLLPSVRNNLIEHCENKKDRFVILQSKRDDAANLGDLFPDHDSKYAGLYMPWINVFDPLNNSQILVPPGGYIAGIYARSDTERGVHKAPANEPVLGATSLQVQISQDQQDVLNPRGVNVIRSFQGRGIIVWGARTISTDPDWKYVNVRRLFIYVEKSIEQSTQWVVFEPNNEALWARVKATITNFLTEVWKTGALMGTKAEEAFFVKCDRTTMTQSDIDNGRLIVVIGIAPTKPAEFVIFRISQTKGGSQVSE